MRVPMCVNAATARTYLLRITRISALAMTGHTLAQVNATIADAIARKELPPMEAGAMCYIMSKQGYGGEVLPHWPSHLIFSIRTSTPRRGERTYPALPCLQLPTPRNI